MKWNVWSTKCAYNVLWWERKKFEKVLVARILSLRALKPPSGRNGKVAEWIVKADQQSDLPEKRRLSRLWRCGGRRRRAWRGMGTSAGVERPSKLRWVEDAPKDSSVRWQEWQPDVRGSRVPDGHCLAGILM